MTNLNDVKAKDPERQQIAAQLEAWRLAGNLPTIVTGCRASAMAPTQAESNAATWENKNGK